MKRISTGAPGKAFQTASWNHSNGCLNDQQVWEITTYMTDTLLPEPEVLNDANRIMGGCGVDALYDGYLYRALSSGAIKTISLTISKKPNTGCWKIKNHNRGEKEINDDSSFCFTLVRNSRRGGGGLYLAAFRHPARPPHRVGLMPGSKGHRQKKAETEVIAPDGYIDDYNNHVIEEAGGSLPVIIRVALPGIIIWWLLYLISQLDP